MTEPRRDPRKADRTAVAATVDFLRARFLSIVAVGCVAAGLLVLVGYDVSIPRRAKLALLAAGLVVPYGFVGGDYVTSLLPDPDWIWLVDLDARVIDGALYRFPSDDWREITVVGPSGEPSRSYEVTDLTPFLKIGKNVDLEAMTVEGTWRGTLSDDELLRALSKVEECRGSLEEKAQRGFAIETQSFSILRNAARSCVMTVIRTFEDGTLPDSGESLADEVDTALEQFDLEDRLSDLDDDGDLDDLLDDERADATATGEPTERSEGERADAAADASEVSADD
ncbi:ORF6 [Haloarcula hispanica pleomorphic virus 1]|uniref:ORF6 n=1 Tax=Haloarcula hispanica pleomorphic virus 1 TaxID=710112 RepID=D3JVC3_9VIRU|nr:unkown [Haloarcula hispanica pleomorphic virus 1]ADB79722.1 ORF6 [Haloarcula hispanica pleomorphic virus 1]